MGTIGALDEDCRKRYYFAFPRPVSGVESQ